MTTEEQLGATLPPDEEQEVEKVTYINCGQCGGSYSVTVSFLSADSGNWGRVRGVLTHRRCKHRTAFEMEDDVVTFLPGQLFEPPSSATADLVRDTFADAEIAFYAGAFRAAVGAARACVEQSLLAKGIPDKKLEDMISDGEQRGMLKDEHLSHAHSTRLIGNRALHRAREVSQARCHAALAATADLVEHIAAWEPPATIEGSPFA